MRQAPFLAALCLGLAACSSAEKDEDTKPPSPTSILVLSAPALSQEPLPEDSPFGSRQEALEYAVDTWTTITGGGPGPRANEASAAAVLGPLKAPEADDATYDDLRYSLEVLAIPAIVAAAKDEDIKRLSGLGYTDKGAADIRSGSGLRGKQVRLLPLEPAEPEKKLADMKELVWALGVLGRRPEAGDKTPPQIDVVLGTGPELTAEKRGKLVVLSLPPSLTAAPPRYYIVTLTAAKVEVVAWPIPGPEAKEDTVPEPIAKASAPLTARRR